MGDSGAELLGILRIGHETSMRGAGLSLREALDRIHYKDRRAAFGPDDLRLVLKAHQELLEEWFAYSENKRTSGGWYLLRSGKIGCVAGPKSQMQFDSVEEAVAEYVVRELDFWAGLATAG
jgi:hypothetical protein